MWSFFVRNSFSLNTSGGVNEAHTHTPHAACFAFKNILISLFHRELNVIDRPGPFKISTSISISSPNTQAAFMPSGNGCPWVGGIVCLHLERQVFLVASSPSLSSLLLCNAVRFGTYICLFEKWFERMQNTAPVTFIVCPPPPSPPLHHWLDRYLFVFAMPNLWFLFRMKKLAFPSLQVNHTCSKKRIIPHFLQIHKEY